MPPCGKSFALPYRNGGGVAMSFGTPGGAVEWCILYTPAYTNGGSVRVVPLPPSYVSPDHGLMWRHGKSFPWPFPVKPSCLFPRGFCAAFASLPGAYTNGGDVRASPPAAGFPNSVPAPITRQLLKSRRAASKRTGGGQAARRPGGQAAGG